jgi:hypothetical protein
VLRAGKLVSDPPRVERALRRIDGRGRVGAAQPGDSITTHWGGPVRWSTRGSAARERHARQHVAIADRARLLERFYRSNNVGGRIPGSGIGLAGTRQIIEQHRGTIAVEGAQGTGATLRGPPSRVLTTNG